MSAGNSLNYKAPLPNGITLEAYQHQHLHYRNVDAKFSYIHTYVHHQIFKCIGGT